jgi:hypothetical protein
MPANYVLLEKITVGAAGASTVTFSSIPQTGYTDLVVKASVQANNSASSSYALQIAYNGNAANYSEIWVRGSGASAGSGGGSGFASTYLGEIPSTFVTNTFGNAEVYIPNYTGSNNKSFSNDGVSEANATTAWATLTAGLWANTSAITSITLSSTVNLAPNSTFYLYGVAKLGTTPAISPKATGGDIIETDGTYWYHAFLSSGTFTPTVGLSCDVIAIAGGGGSGRTGGGGGAGGLRGLTAQSLANATAYTVTIGGGGAGATSDGTVATNGTNSSVSGTGLTTITASGGGGGGSYKNSGAGIAGASGGSGGGGGTSDGSASGFAGGSGNSGSYSPVEGFAGGNGTATRGGGGGGGATAVGANSTTNNGGAGGAGSSTYSSWGIATETGQLSGGVRYFAGGGGGAGASAAGAGGLGGGGTGNNNGIANTGGGAGSNNDNNGMTGGSGIVIMRYAV